MSDERTLLLTHYRGADAAFYLEDNVLLEVQLENEKTASAIGRIYVGRIKTIAEGIGAAFVEYEKGKIGFLPLSQITPDLILNRQNPDKIAPEQELLVQVYKDPMKNKDATLTTDLLFSGKYIVMTPMSKGIRFSRKLKKEEKNTLLARIQTVLSELFGDPEVFLCNYGCIIRTNARDADDSELFYEFHELFHDACKVLSDAKTRTTFSLLYKDAPFFRRILRNQYDPGSLRVYTDDPAIRDFLLPKNQDALDEEYRAALSHLDEEERSRFITLLESMSEKVRQRMGSDAKRGGDVQLWDKDLPMQLFFKLGASLDRALQKKVWLDCGGFLVIEPTEALTVIDVNSGKAASKKKEPEGFNLKINLEAATEIAKQLRVRNLSGMILVDFINLEEEESKKTLMHALKRCLQTDPIGANLVDMTALGLIEITRKKTQAPLSERIRMLN
ncbi:MAG: ribonuclease E/G [Lachnospiraceae bacterium]|nr:ribonuclease E/G [Lachnospiraceae bacterium]